MNTVRTSSPCPQCKGHDIEITLVSAERYHCRCQSCGYAWVEPGLRPARDRRQAPREE